MADPRLVNALEGLVVGAVGLTTAALDSFAPSSDLTLQQWRALVVIARGDGIRVGELAARMGMAVPSTSRLVRRLESRRLAATQRDESDRRATIVSATTEGIELWSSLVEHRRTLIAEMLDALGRPLPTTVLPDVETLEEAFAAFA